MVLVRVNSLLNKTVKNPHKLCDVTHKKYSPECNVLIYTGLGVARLLLFFLLILIVEDIKRCCVKIKKGMLVAICH